MGKTTTVDPLIFPLALRPLAELRSYDTADAYKAEMEKLSLGELKMAHQIMLMTYPGAMMAWKGHVKAEIRRREKNIEKVGREDAELPKWGTWSEDFARLWEEACEPFRRLKWLKRY